MDTIDELGRRAARTALAEAEAYTDVEAGLARILADEDDVDWNIGGDRRRGWVVVLAAAAAVVAAVTAGVVWSQDDPSPRLVPATPPVVTPAPTTPATPQPTTPATPEPQPAEPSGLAVSYRDPPPLLEPTVFATVASDPSGSIAATEGGGAVLTSPSAGVATLVALDGTTRTVPLDLVPSGSPMVAGPGDVLYGLVFETDPPSRGWWRLRSLASGPAKSSPRPRSRSGPTQNSPRTPSDMGPRESSTAPAGWDNR